ncbi:MAG: DEAD/DEAH box helicase [Phycisphaerales bacterium]|nr:MAG: DEAD/DEAH box helicase [Phycisphaerales bacterium]
MIKNIQNVLARYWGFDGFLPLQKQAIECVARGKDSIVVLPTGGGKSLCFQAPAVVMPGLTVVVSPHISLMKDPRRALMGGCSRRCGACELRLPGKRRCRLTSSSTTGRCGRWPGASPARGKVCSISRE